MSHKSNIPLLLRNALDKDNRAKFKSIPSDTRLVMADAADDIELLESMLKDIANNIHKWEEIR